jgi:hypothetical protein
MSLPTSSRDRIADILLATSNGDASATALPPPGAFFAEDPSEHARVRKTPTPKNPNARVDPAFMTILTVPERRSRKETPTDTWIGFVTAANAIDQPRSPVSSFHRVLFYGPARDEYRAMR